MESGGEQHNGRQTQEAIMKTDLMKGVIKSDRASGPVSFKALADAYLSLPSIKK